jgi:hypothetical protein
LSESIQTDSEIQLFLGNRNQQVSASGNPDLAIDGIRTRSVKCFDVKVLFNPFEKFMESFT